MTSLVTLALICFGFALFDEWLTRRRIRDYGLQVEINASIRKCVEICGLELGVLVGLLLPSFAIIVLFVLLKWVLALAILAGFRARMFLYQLESIWFEAECKAIAKKLNQDKQD